MHRDRLQEAHARFAKALETCPDDVDCRRNLARVLWKQDQPELAIEEMDAAIPASGGKPDWTVELGQMLFAQQEYPQALECAERALESCQELPAAWRLQGDVYQRTNRPTDALQAYHRALASGDRSAFVMSQIASIYRAQGRPRRALSTLQRLEDELPEAEHPERLALWQGIALQSLGRHEDAIDRFVSARGELGNDPELLVLLAESQVTTGQLDGARETIQLASAVECDDPRIAQLVAYIDSHDASRVAHAGHSGDP
jgi:tetratricopeptide (TPR) repeat protein